MQITWLVAMDAPPAAAGVGSPAADAEGDRRAHACRSRPLGERNKEGGNEAAIKRRKGWRNEKGRARADTVNFNQPILTLTLADAEKERKKERGTNAF